MSKTYCVYTIANRSRGLYTGVTGDLESRLVQHRRGESDFSSRFKIFRLVHFEMFADVLAAIRRQKEIKAWRREKKVRLIESKNPAWVDLSPQLPHVYKTNQKTK